METLILQLVTSFTPIVTQAIRDHKAANAGADPTDAEIIARLEANVAKYLGEGAAWKAAHPDA